MCPNKEMKKKSLLNKTGRSIPRSESQCKKEMLCLISSSAATKEKY